MKTSEYYKSEAHITSINNANKIAKTYKYSCINCKNVYPTFNFKKHICKPCPVCNKIIIGQVKKFCSKSCAAKFNSKKRTVESRIQQTITIKKKFLDNPDLRDKFKKTPQPPTFCRIAFLHCKLCKNIFMINSWRKDPPQFCSQDCRTKSRMSKQTNHHGHKKIFKYFNIYLNEIINLESTWELKMAEFLDDLKIIWIRPQPISWLDTNLKSHLYYADFYLPEYNLYLDPKNPYVMQKDAYKMSVIEQKVNIFYGAMKHIKNNIQNVLGKSTGQGAGS